MKTQLRLLLIITLVLSSCSTRSTLDIKDLQLPDQGALDIDREAIKRNQTRKTIITYVSDDPVHSDTIWYDDDGRRIYESNNQRKIALLYDASGLMVAKKAREHSGEKGFHSVDSAVYSYQPDSLILSQSWMNGSNVYKYYFNENGKLTKISIFKKSNLKITYSTSISYLGQLPTRIEMLKYDSNQVSTFGHSEFYYENDKIDSLVFSIAGQRETRIVYDDNGLPKASYYGGRLSETYSHYKM